MNSDGTFSVTVTLAPGEEGTASAMCIDWFGQDSDTVYEPVQY